MYFFFSPLCLFVRSSGDDSAVMAVGVNGRAAVYIGGRIDSADHRFTTTRIRTEIIANRTNTRPDTSQHRVQQNGYQIQNKVSDLYSKNLIYCY